LGAGSFEVPRTAGAMHRMSGRAGLTAVRFGFDERHLFVRVDAERPVVDLLAEGREISFKFLTPAGLRYSVRQSMGRLTGGGWTRYQDGASVRWTNRGPGGATTAAGAVLEVSLPLTDLGLEAGATVEFIVAVYDGEIEVERHPEHRPITMAVPGPA